jgi:hypothetical protein
VLRFLRGRTRSTYLAGGNAVLFLHYMIVSPMVPMNAAKAYLRLALVLACIVVSVAAMLNVFADNADVLANAKELGCPKTTCTLTRMERTPFAQTFEFQSAKGAVVVKCARGTVFFGEYACARQ